MPRSHRGTISALRFALCNSGGYCGASGERVGHCRPRLSLADSGCRICDLSATSAASRLSGQGRTIAPFLLPQGIGVGKVRYGPGQRLRPLPVHAIAPCCSRGAVGKRGSSPFVVADGQPNSPHSSTTTNGELRQAVSQPWGGRACDGSRHRGDDEVAGGLRNFCVSTAKISG